MSWWRRWPVNAPCVAQAQPRPFHALVLDSGDRSPAGPSRGVRRERLGVSSPALGAGCDVARSRPSSASRKALWRRSV